MSGYRAKSADEGVRTDVFVASKYPEFTRSSLEVLFDESLVSVNGRPAKPSYNLKIGDKVTVDDQSLKIEPDEIDLPVLYEDNEVVVINKPSGILTHSKGAINHEATVASFLKPKLTDEKLMGNRAGIVHRLDRGTSGIIICAKTAEAQKWLQKQFSTRKVKKIYLAVVEGTPEAPEAIIDAPIERNPRHPQSFRVGNGGKPAQTRYKLLQTAMKDNKPYSLLELKPVTGRTHQLRVHLSYIGHPIKGDHVYGRDDGPMLLHAVSLELTLPSGVRKVFETPPPNTFTEFLNG